jgi:hypothetical protein
MKAWTRPLQCRVLQNCSMQHPSLILNRDIVIAAPVLRIHELRLHVQSRWYVIKTCEQPLNQPPHTIVPGFPKQPQHVFPCIPLHGIHVVSPSPASNSYSVSQRLGFPRRITPQSCDALFLAFLHLSHPLPCFPSEAWFTREKDKNQKVRHTMSCNCPASLPEHTN